MATFLANERNATDRKVVITDPKEQVQIMFPLKNKSININNAGYLKPFFSGTLMNKQSKKVELCVI